MISKSSFHYFSWINFWIDPQSTPERAGLTITLALAQIVLITGVEQSFPSVSDFKMIDIYLIVNFLFNMACLIQTVVASVVAKRTRKFGNYSRHREKAIQDDPDDAVSTIICRFRVIKQKKL